MAIMVIHIRRGISRNDKGFCKFVEVPEAYFVYLTEKRTGHCHVGLCLGGK